MGHELYCFADPVFYDSAILHLRDEENFAFARRPAPEGWERLTTGDWVEFAPTDARLPAQGWKIHASACIESAEQILRTVWDHCVPRGIAFKFIRSQQLLFLRNAKYANRSASGKFITIYPRDEEQFGEILRELGDALDGMAGPYILSDLRWGAGPLFARYGGFSERHCVGTDGALAAAIEDPHGELVPDRRGATFYLPPWVTLPACLEPHLSARNSSKVDDLPYRIDSALHFSNGGGVYAGVERATGERVVLKEARPHAGLALDRADAVARLGRERDMLTLLAGLNVPAVRDYFTVAEHHFLVMDFVEGRSLNSHLVERCPGTWNDADRPAMEDYAAWMLDVHERLEQAVAGIHERGVILNDIHPKNVIVEPDGRIVLIDLETAWRDGEDRRQTMADPGFMAPRTCRGYDIDLYALACLRLFSFLPITDLIALDCAKARHLADEIAEIFPVSRDWLDDAVATIVAAHDPDVGAASMARPRPRLEPEAASWLAARDSMAAAILRSATPDRDDRLFPGDIRQFDTGGGLNFAHGAAGVLYALAATGAGRHPEHEEWLVRRALAPQPGTPIGFYDGLHGVAHVLERLDRRDDALALLELLDAELDGKLEKLGLDLWGGLAGIGLNLAHFAAATADSSLWEATLRVADIVASRVSDDGDDGSDVSGGGHPFAGLTRGSAGPALFFLRLYERFGDPGLLDVAATALRQDLRRCVVREDSKTLEVNEGWRTMPYLDDGSVGIGVVLDDYLGYRGDEQFAEAAAAIRPAADYAFFIYPSLLKGRAGMLLYHARSRASGIAGLDGLIDDHVRRLAWHALPFEGRLAFPGEKLLRLSMDLATGTAGVLLGLGAALHDDPVQLPFLAPLPDERRPRVPDEPLAAERR